MGGSRLGGARSAGKRSTVAALHGVRGEAEKAVAILEGLSAGCGDPLTASEVLTHLAGLRLSTPRRPSMSRGRDDRAIGAHAGRDAHFAGLAAAATSRRIHWTEVRDQKAGRCLDERARKAGGRRGRGRAGQGPPIPAMYDALRATGEGALRVRAVAREEVPPPGCVRHAITLGNLGRFHLKDRRAEERTLVASSTTCAIVERNRGPRAARVVVKINVGPGAHGTGRFDDAGRPSRRRPAPSRPASGAPPGAGVRPEGPRPPDEPQGGTRGGLSSFLECRARAPARDKPTFARAPRSCSPARPAPPRRRPRRKPAPSSRRPAPASTGSAPATKRRDGERRARAQSRRSTASGTQVDLPPGAGMAAVSTITSPVVPDVAKISRRRMPEKTNQAAIARAHRTVPSAAVGWAEGPSGTSTRAFDGREGASRTDVAVKVLSSRAGSMPMSGSRACSASGGSARS